MTPLRTFARDDSGMALVVALGAVALMVVIATAAFALASQTLFETQLADQHDIAFQAASSGVLVAFTDLRTNLASHPPGGTYTGSIATSAAVYTAVATRNAAGTGYDCTSTGTSRDGTREVVQATFSIVAGGAEPGIWSQSILSAPDALGGVTGNGQIVGPVYLKFTGVASQNVLDFTSAGAGFSAGPIYIENADLILKNVPPVPVDIYTNGTITLEGTVKNRPEMIINRGWDSSYVRVLTPVDTTAYLATALQTATRQSSDNKLGYDSSTVVNYESQPVASPASYASLSTNPPNNQPTGWLRSRAPGGSQAYKVISGDLTIGSSTASFGSWSGDGHYPTNGLHDDLAFDSARGMLYVEGVVYVNGDLIIDTDITYVGGGTIVCSGSAIFRDSMVPATPDGADGTPDPAAGYTVGIFCADDLVVETNGVVVTAAVYTTSRIAVEANNVTLKGSFMAERGISDFPNGLDLIGFPGIGGYPPQGLPEGLAASSGGGGTSTLGIASWRRL